MDRVVWIRYSTTKEHHAVYDIVIDLILGREQTSIVAGNVGSIFIIEQCIYDAGGRRSMIILRRLLSLFLLVKTSS